MTEVLTDRAMRRRRELALESWCDRDDNGGFMGLQVGEHGNKQEIYRPFREDGKWYWRKTNEVHPEPLPEAS